MVAMHKLIIIVSVVDQRFLHEMLDNSQFFEIYTDVSGIFW